MRTHCSLRPAAALIHINPREAEGPPGVISLAGGAQETLTAIDVALNTL